MRKKGRRMRKRRYVRRVRPRGMGGIIGLPAQQKFKHVYTYTQQSTTTSGVIVTNLFSTNGMTTPKSSGATTQPQYFDQLAALYNHYTIIGSKCTVRAIPNPSSANSSVFVGLYLEDDTSIAPTTNTDFLNQKSPNTYRVLGPQSGNGVTLVSRWSAKKLGGKVMANPNMQGTTAANPTEQQWWCLYIGPIDGSSTTVTQFVVEIQYIAVWREPKRIVAS